MMWIKKLQSQKGEMLVESLVSMLIAVLSMGLIATCAMTATKINEQNRAKDAAFSQDLQAAEARSVSETETLTPQITITFSSDDRVAELGANRSSKAVDVVLYGGREFVSYERKEIE